MAKYYSPSTGQISDTAPSSNVSAPSGGQMSQPEQAQMTSLGIPYDKLQQIFFAMGLSYPKNASELSTILGMVKPVPETAAAKKAKQAKADADRIITQLENSYFKDKLHMGNNLQGILTETVIPSIDPNNPYSVWKSMLESDRPFLAKAAGDAGNIALQEQIQAGKPFPTARSDYQTAVKRFTEIRNKFGLPVRSYGKTNSYSPSGLEDIGKQFGG